MTILSKSAGTRMAFGRWEIKRRSRPLGVKLYNSGFRAPAEAQLAGEQFLKDFLDAISQEKDGD
jgi:hypothetical protein